MEPKKYIVVDHTTGIKYEVTEHADELGYLHKNSKPINNEVKPEPIDYTKEVKRPYKKAFPAEDAKNKQLERDALQWKQYYKDNHGKIPNEFPKSIFDNKKKVI